MVEAEHWMRRALIVRKEIEESRAAKKKINTRISEDRPLDATYWKSRRPAEEEDLEYMAMMSQVMHESHYKRMSAKSHGRLLELLNTV